MSTGLLDHRGEPLRPSNHAKLSPPKLGEAFAPEWGSATQRFLAHQMPGLGIVQFDLSKLKLEDFRVMRDHYQINATLAVMSFMLHQMDWHIECDNTKIKKHVTENMKKIWTQLIRCCSNAHWAGHSPNVLQWENDLSDKTIQLEKIKDLMPEMSRVHWKKIDGWSPPGHFPPKIHVYDGIWVWGQNWPIPKDNTFWYPVLMENGDMEGRKLLRPAFTSWYFSILMHLFSNRYFERFGEPVPIGRAPYDEDVTINTATGQKQSIPGAQLMLQMLQNLRNRSVVVLPNDRTAVSAGQNATGNVQYDYEIEYLESQMRGADFERYMTRLDEEISLSLFTPLLVLRTADVGSYNLGSTHWQMYLNMLNALADDMKIYMQRYIISRMVDFNFGPNAPRAEIVFRKMGDDRKEMVTAILQSLIPQGSTKPDLEQLGQIAGLNFTEVQQLTAPPGTDPTAKPPAKADPQAKATGGGTKPSPAKTPAKTKSTANSMRVLAYVSSRCAAQTAKAIRDDTDLVLRFGYERQLSEALIQDDLDITADRIYSAIAGYVADLGGKSHFDTHRIDEMETFYEARFIDLLEVLNSE